MGSIAFVPMDMKLSPTTTLPGIKLGNLAGAAGVKSALNAKGQAGEVAKAEGFADAFKSALNSVSQAQNQASRLQREVQMENPKVSLEETMVAMQKAQIGFQSALHVRNRMVQAYTDIMNMSV